MTTQEKADARALVELTPKLMEQIVAAVWLDYYTDMDKGHMRQTPGRSEYEGALIKMGFLNHNDQSKWRDWFFNVYSNEQSPVRKAMLRATRKAKRKTDTGAL